MTQVPRSRYSSATMTLAPCSAAMRAARTPPDPPPMTKRSTSCSAMLQIVSALFHLGAHFVDDVLGKIVRPGAGHGHALLHGLWFLVNNFLAKRRLIETQELLQFRLGKVSGIDPRGAVQKLFRPRVVLPFQIGGDLIEVLTPHEVRLHEHVSGLYHHPADHRLKGIFDMLYFQYLPRHQKGGRRRLMDCIRRGRPLSGGRPSDAGQTGAN